MANSKHYRQSGIFKFILYLGKEPKKHKKIRIPVQDVALVDMYDSIDHVPEEKKGEFLRALLAE